jgi:MarR family transcriptional regulator, organic hydroperoxide resistance regulator
LKNSSPCVEGVATDISSGPGLTQPVLPVGDAIDFLRLIWAVDHALQRRSKSMAAELGITGPQRLVIRIVGRFPSIHARQLANILHLHPSSLTAVLKRLERHRLVRRWPDEKDRRRWLLGLTRKGQALNQDTPGTIEAAVQRMLTTTNRHDLDVTRAVLGKLARELDGTRQPARGRRTRNI